MRVQHFSQKSTFPYIWKKSQQRSSSIKLINKCYLEEPHQRLVSKSLDKIQSNILVSSPKIQDKSQFASDLFLINNKQQENQFQQKQKENIFGSLNSLRFCNKLLKEYQNQLCKTVNSLKPERTFDNLILFPFKSVPDLYEQQLFYRCYNNEITQSLSIIEQNKHQINNLGKSKSISNILINEKKQLFSLRSYQPSHTPISANNYNKIKRQQKYQTKIERKKKKIKKLPYLLKCDVSLSIQSYEKKFSNKLGTFSDSFNYTPKNQHQEVYSDQYILNPEVQHKHQSEKVVQNNNEYISQKSFLQFEPIANQKESNSNHQQNMIELICFSESDNNKSEDQKQVNKIIQSDSDSDSEQKIALNICEICRQFNELFKYLPCIHQFCKECYVDYLQDKIKYAEVLNITCPSCEQIFPETIIQCLVTQEYFEKYKNYKYAQEVDQDPTRKWCPKPGCHNVIQKNNRSNVVLCECGSKICFLCGNLDHGNQSCQSVLNQQFQLAIKHYSIKPCPNCKSPIQKSSGCNHMNCSKCKFQFCWICLQKYHQYHYRYWSIKGCAVWSNGRYNRNMKISNPDLRRHLFLIPRFILFLIRGPLIIVKLFFKASYESIKRPYIVIMKETKKSIRGVNACVEFCVMFIMMYIAVFIALLFYPFTLIFHYLPEEIQMMRIKGCAY